MNTSSTSTRAGDVRGGGPPRASRPVLLAAAVLSAAAALPGQAAFGPVYWLQQGNAVPPNGYSCYGAASPSTPYLGARVGTITGSAAIFWSGCGLEPNHPMPPPPGPPAGQSATIQVYLRDFLSGVTLLLSVNAAGMAGNANSTICSLSSNGRYATFLTEATDIVTPDANGRNDIVWMDVVTGAKELVSVGTSGQQGDGDCYRSYAGDGGRFVVFESNSSNLVPNDSNNTWDVFLRDRLLGTTTLVSAAMGVGTANGHSGVTGISPDSEHVLFDSLATNLVQGPLSLGRNIYLWSRSTGQIELISPSTSTPPGSAYYPSMSADARYVVFECSGGFCLRDRQTQTTSVLPVSGSRPRISGDGRYIAFTGSGNYVPNPSGSGYLSSGEPYRYDRLTGEVMHAGVTEGGEYATPFWYNGSGCTAMSPDGRYLAVETPVQTLWPTTGFLGGVDFWAIDMGPGETLGPGAGGFLVPPLTRVVDGGPSGVWSFSLRYVPQTAPVVLAVKAAPAGVPVAMHGGFVHPWPPDFLLPLSVPASGPLVLPFQWLPATPQGTQVQGQWAVLDPASPAGVSLSNAYLVARP